MSAIYLIPGWRLGRGPLLSLAETLNAQWCDLPGYRDAPLVSDFAAAAAGVAERIPCGSALIGWSLGAMLALAAAAQRPAHFRAVVAIAVTPSFVQRPDWPYGLPAEQLAAFTDAMLSNEAETLPRFVGSFNRGDARAKSLTAYILEHADPAPAPEVLRTGLSWLAEVDLRTKLAQITCPVLVIHGAVDGLIPAAAGRWMAEHLPQGQWYEVPEAAHAPFLSRAEEVSREIAAFIAETA